LLVGVLTRQGVAPFHQWLPGLTQAAPGVVALFVPTLLVTAAAFALIRIVDSIAPVSLPAFGAMFSMLSVVSMVVGSVMALVQSNIKRMLAYGGVAHAGFLLAAVNVQTAEGRAAALFHITVFLFMQVGVLGAISAISGAERTRKTWELLSDYTGLAASRPILAAAMTIFLVALAGVPGTSGFMSRFIVMSAVVGDGQMLVTLAMTISSVILFAAYLRVPTAMYMGHTVADDPDALPIPAVFALSVCAIVTIYLGLFPGPGPASFETLDIVRRAVQP
jgi:NADH-quinone oxidoreductase subunit N